MVAAVLGELDLFVRALQDLQALTWSTALPVATNDRAGTITSSP